MSYILILYIYAGTFAKGDSVALTNIPNFKTYANCEKAGKQALNMVSGFKSGKYVCVEQ